jgi:hypothetical protein
MLRRQRKLCARPAGKRCWRRVDHCDTRGSTGFIAAISENYRNWSGLSEETDCLIRVSIWARHTDRGNSLVTTLRFGPVPH